MSIDRGVTLTLDLVPQSDKLSPALHNITDLLKTADSSAKSMMTNLAVDPKGFEGLGAAMEKANAAGKAFVGLEISDVYERWSKATTSLMSETDSMESQLDKLNLALDPKALKERVSLTLQLEEAQKKVKNAIDLQREAQTGMSAETEAQQAALERLNASMNPEAIEKRVEMTLKLEDAQKRQKLLLEQEREAQTGKKADGDKGGGLGDGAGYLMDILPGRLGAFARIGMRLHGQLSKHAKDAQEKAEKQRLLTSDPDEGGASLVGGGKKGMPSITDMLGGKGGNAFRGGGKGGGPGGGLGDMLGGGAEGAEAGMGDMAMAGGEAAGGEGMMAMAGPVGAVAAAGVMAAGALKSLAEETFNTGKAFTQLSDPATVGMFDRAVRDSQAVLGDRFVPILEFATEGMREWGDMLQTIVPSAGEVSTELEELRPAFNELKDACAELAPMMKQGLTDGLQAAGWALKSFSETVVNIKKGWDTVTGGMLKENVKPIDSAMGMAHESTSLGGLESVHTSILTSAYSQGRGSTPMAKTESTLDKIKGLIDELKKSLDPAIQKYVGVSEGLTEGANAALAGDMDGLAKAIGKAIATAQTPPRPRKP